MYISANKVNITHSYTPQKGSTSPSTAGHKETSEPLPVWNWNRGARSASTHTLRRRWTWASLTSLIFTEKDKDLSMNPKASLPSWQIGVCLKSPFLFLKTPCTRTKTIKVKRTKQNKHLISHKDLWILQGFKFSYKIFNHAAITRQTNWTFPFWIS